MPVLALPEIAELGVAAVEGTEAVSAASTATAVGTAGTATGTAVATGTEVLTAAQQAERLRKAARLLAALAAAGRALCKTCCKRVFVLSMKANPETAKHTLEAQAQGYPSTGLTIDRPGAAARRASSLKGIPAKSGFDRDEYPPAMFVENLGEAHVKYIDPSDNQSAGSKMRWALADAPEGCKVTIEVGP